MAYFDILIKLRKILRTVNLESKRIEKSYGVSIPQLLILQYLQDQSEFKSTATKIKAYINLNASTVSGILQRLEQKELIVRMANEADKRSSQVILTAKGLKLLSSAPTTMQERLTQKLESMPAEQRMELHKNLDLLIQLMDLQDVDAAPVLFPGEISEKPL